MKNIDLQKLASILLPTIVIVVFMFFIFAILKNSVDERQRVKNAFENNIELICYAKIVSKANGYRYDDKRTDYITNGIDIFLLSRCYIK